MRILLTLAALTATPALAHADGVALHVPHEVYVVAALAVAALVVYRVLRKR